MTNQREESVKEGFDKLYESAECIWGLQADKYLAMFLQEARKGRALDVGCGEGRHSLYLAQEGYLVDAIDISENAIQKLRSLAEEYGFSELISPRTGDLRTLDLLEGRYDLAVVSYVFPFLKRSDILTVLDKVKLSLKSGGCIYASAVTTDDEEYRNYVKEQQPIEPRTYYSPGLKCYCYYFEKGELKTLFSDFDIIDYTETVVILQREPYSHAMCLIFARKR